MRTYVGPPNGDRGRCHEGMLSSSVDYKTVKSINSVRNKTKPSCASGLFFFSFFLDFSLSLCVPLPSFLFLLFLSFCSILISPVFWMLVQYRGPLPKHMLSTTTQFQLSTCLVCVVSPVLEYQIFLFLKSWYNLFRKPSGAHDVPLLEKTYCAASYKV